MNGWSPRLVATAEESVAAASSAPASIGRLYSNSRPLRYRCRMRFDDVVSRLTPSAFSRLPGAEAQEPLSPRPRRTWPDPGAAGAARPAAALALLYPDRDDTAILLTVRGSHLLRHGGQVSLPGGAIEPGETVEDAALRESAEEVGLDPAAVTMRGRLTPLSIPVSGYLLHAVV